MEATARRSVILRVSEAHDLGDTDRFKLYEHMKSYIAAPPEFHRVDEKNIPEHPVPNVTGVVITTNHKTDGIYLPANDRRHFVAWSDSPKKDKAYFDALYAYFYKEGGNDAVAVYLRQRDITNFNPYASPPQTAAFWAMVEAGADPEQGDLADLLNKHGRPPAVTLAALQQVGRDGVDGAFADWLADRKNRRVIPHRMEACGYTPIKNGDQQDGRWKIAGKNVIVYALRSLSYHEKLAAARALAAEARS
jgi:hypothetical protein